MSTMPVYPKRIEYIKTESQVDRAVADLLRFDVLGWDTETFNKYDRRKDAFDPIQGARMRLSQWASPEGNAYVFDHFHINSAYLWRMFPNPFLLVGQNLKFDLKFIMHELGIDQFGEIFDTMLAGQLNAKGRVSGDDFLSASLDALVYRELDNIVLPKDEQKSDWWRPELTSKQIEYAARDALIVLPLYKKQVGHLKNEHQVRTAQIEFNTVPSLADIELNGIGFDKHKWQVQYDENDKKVQEKSLILWDALALQGSLFDGIETLNLTASGQVIEAFKRKGLPVPIDPKTGNESVDIKLLKPFEEAHPIIKIYREFKKLDKNNTSFGPKWFTYIGPDGRIHASYKSIGAETGRMSCSGPNLQQIPQDNFYRNCFVASPGWVIVGFDYSQCELRILAEYCRDPNFLRAFDQELDLHYYTASLIFKCKISEVTDKQRAIAKNLNFGIVYGIGVGKFAQDAGLSRSEAQSIMNYYLKEAYPMMSIWLDRQALSVFTNNMQARTMSGRIRQYYGDTSDREIYAKIQRNAKNLPIQGTNVDITKRALHFVYQALRHFRGKIRAIHVVHDEIICECLPAYVEVCKDILKTCMIRAEKEFLKRVPSVVDSSVTLMWTKKCTPEMEKEAQALIALAG